MFKGLDNMVKNFLVSVPLVADLRSPAMRDRHWQQLMEATKVSSVRVCIQVSADGFGADQLYTTASA